MNLPKIFGWVILLIGIIIIGWSLYSSYNIFTGRAPLPEIFKFTPQKEEIPEEVSLKPEEIQKQIELLIKQQLEKLIPRDFIAKILNLISWSILAVIFFFGGSKISELGIKLIKG